MGQSILAKNPLSWHLQLVVNLLLSPSKQRFICPFSIIIFPSAKYLPYSLKWLFMLPYASSLYFTTMLWRIFLDFFWYSTRTKGFIWAFYFKAGAKCKSSSVNLTVYSVIWPWFRFDSFDAAGTSYSSIVSPVICEIIGFSSSNAVSISLEPLSLVVPLLLAYRYPHSSLFLIFFHVALHFDSTPRLFYPLLWFNPASHLLSGPHIPLTAPWETKLLSWVRLSSSFNFPTTF